MSRIIIEYRPNLSMESRIIIRENVSPSMVAPDEESSQYDICMCETELAEYDDVYEEDLDLIKLLTSQGVHYLEF